MKPNRSFFCELTSQGFQHRLIFVAAKEARQEIGVLKAVALSDALWQAHWKTTCWNYDLITCWKLSKFGVVNLAIWFNTGKRNWQIIEKLWSTFWRKIGKQNHVSPPPRRCVAAHLVPSRAAWSRSGWMASTNRNGPRHSNTPGVLVEPWGLERGFRL